MIAAARDDWQTERRLLNRWAIWCCRGDDSTIRWLCGLTWAGSPRTPDLLRRGAATAADVTGYAREHVAAPDGEPEQVDMFMWAVSRLLPEVYQALLARHRRIVFDKAHVDSPEWQIACELYGKSRSHSHAKLADACAIGYAAMRRWFATPGLA